MIARAAAAFVVGVAVLSAAPSVSRSGLDLDAIDPNVRPQDDLFRYANGRWLAHAVIPSDRVAYGTFVEMADTVERDLHAIAETAAAAVKKPRGSAVQLLGDFYSSFMDEARIEAIGAAPLAAELARIDAIATPSQFAAEASYMSSLAIGGPFVPTVIVEGDDPARQIVQVSQSGTRLPNRDYYLSADPEFVEIRRQYESYLTTILTLAGRPGAASTAHDVLVLETAIARCQLPPVESRTATLAPRRTTFADLMVEMPGFDWKAWARPQQLERFSAVALAQPTFFKCFSALVPVMPLATWKSWLATRHIYQASPYLSRAFRDARFAFFGRILTGQAEIGERWISGVALMNAFLGDALGRLYVEQHFPPLARDRAAVIVRRVVAAYKDVLAESSWLSRGAKSEAIAKLSHTTPRIGHPDSWRDYAGLVIDPTDLFGNWRRAHIINSNERLARIGAMTLNDEPGVWLRNVQTVNAFYSPALNEILLPAALLQPPIFDVDADDAVNFGALGVTIGHELTHAFDERGRRFDAGGRVRAWWRPEDETEFQRRSARLVEEFNRYQPLPGVTINGELTRPENVADLAGLSVAYRAYRASLNGRPAPVIDGFSGDQRFFLSYARMWRMTVRPDYLRQWLQTLQYSPEEFRTNAIASHVDGFADAFGLRTGDRLFRPPAERLQLW